MSFRSSLVFAAVAFSFTACQPETENEPSSSADSKPAVSTTTSDSETSAQALQSLSTQSIQFGNPLIKGDGFLAHPIYEFEAKRWFKSVMGHPWSTGIVADTTGAACGQNQSGLVWQLAGNSTGTVTRDCTIPAGQFLFFPVLNFWEVVLADQIAQDGLPAVTAGVASDILFERQHACGQWIKLDGHDLLVDPAIDQHQYVTYPKLFNVPLDADNFTNGFLGAGTYLNGLGGTWALLAPLTPGHHTLEFGGNECDDDTQPGVIQFTNDTTYHLFVH